MRAALSVRESVHFLPLDFIKRRFSRLSLEDHCNRGAGKGQQECFVSAATSISVRSVSHVHTISACLRGSVCALPSVFLDLWNCLTCSTLCLLLLMKDIFSFAESCGVQDSCYHLHHLDLGLALIGVNHNPLTDCQLNNLTFKWQEFSKGYSPARSQRGLCLRHCHQCCLWNTSHAGYRVFEHTFQAYPCS